jgi:hypothetical protein
MQIPILNGVYTAEDADYSTSYPINMMPVIQSTGISNGYLRPVRGITEISRGPGPSRGAINWNDIHYRVMGAILCKIDENGNVTQLGNVGNDGLRVSMDYSFSMLAIKSDKRLFYFYDTNNVDDSTWSYDLIQDTGDFRLIEVTAVALGDVVDMVWVDGYFMTTDGEYLVVTELNEPTAITATKYGSSEIDPDPVNGLAKLRNEVYAINRYTIEVFDNVGGSNFPFQRVSGAQIEKGSLGTYCSKVYKETVAFLGSGRNESPGVYMAAGGSIIKISTREIDEILSKFTESALAESVMETMNDKSHDLLWIRIPDRTLVYDLTASTAAGEAIWYIMSSSPTDLVPYKGRDIVWVYNDWYCGDTQSSKIGVLDDAQALHFGDVVKWEFSTKIIYNENRGVLFNKLELVVLPGRYESDDTAVISTSYSVDGRTWSQPRTIKAGAFGDREKRLVWWRQGHMKHTRIQKFTGDSKTYLAASRLDATLEELGV